jgi:hypothetical protein
VPEQFPESPDLSESGERDLYDARGSEDISYQDTSHQDDPSEKVTAEKILSGDTAESAAVQTAPGLAAAGPDRQTPDMANVLAGQSPERIETVLNSGMAFISGLMEMATGQKVNPTAASEKMVNINRETGEVTLSFKLPGWG